MISTKQRIPLIVFAVASVIGLMAVTAIAAMSMQKAYSQTQRWCFDIKTPHGTRPNCYNHGFPENNEAACNAARDAALKGKGMMEGSTVNSECYKD